MMSWKFTANTRFSNPLNDKIVCKWEYDVGDRTEESRDPTETEAFPAL